MSKSSCTAFSVIKTFLLIPLHMLATCYYELCHTLTISDGDRLRG